MLNLILLLRSLPALLLRTTWNLAATMTPKYVPATITATRTNLFPIAGKPKYNYLIYLRELLTPILLGIPYNTSEQQAYTPNRSKFGYGSRPLWHRWHAVTFMIFVPRISGGLGQSRW